MSVVWIESAGGPLLVAPESKLAHWSGSTDDDGPVETWGDYGRACQVQDCIGLVDVCYYASRRSRARRRLAVDRSVVTDLIP